MGLKFNPLIFSGFDFTGGGSSSGITGADNVGTGEGTIVRDITVGTLNIKTLKAGLNVTITDDADEITIEASGGGGSANSFYIIQTPEGTSPTATSSTDVLDLKSTSGTNLITGDATDDSVDFQTVAVLSETGVAAKITSDSGISLNGDGVVRSPAAGGWVEVYTNGRFRVVIASSALLEISNRLIMRANLCFLDGGATENTIDIGLSPSAALERPRNIYVGTNVNVPNLPVYADNAAATAGGLAVGWMYRTSTGEMKVRY